MKSSRTHETKQLLGQALRIPPTPTTWAVCARTKDSLASFSDITIALIPFHLCVQTAQCATHIDQDVT